MGGEEVCGACHIVMYEYDFHVCSMKFLGGREFQGPPPSV